MTEIDELAEQLHTWYLEATRELNPESYNIKAQVDFDDLTEEQKSIDRFIALALQEYINKEILKELELAIGKMTLTKYHTGKLDLDWIIHRIGELKEKLK
jgi:hypothetical protein